jgi:hypothetical protein
MGRESKGPDSPESEEFAVKPLELFRCALRDFVAIASLQQVFAALQRHTGSCDIPECYCNYCYLDALPASLG